MTAVPSCSASPLPSATRWRDSLRSVPSLVAESLAGHADPLSQWLRPGLPAPAEQVAAALARALLPPAANDEPPVWLRADQRLSFARALAAIRKYGGAVLADRVGSGKTFIGLAVARALDPGRPIHVLVPATLRAQWRLAACQTGCEVRLHSHELLSRGRLPAAEPGPVLIDESHRFRTPTTRRYETLAPWCVGRRGLLLTATPAVNQLEDLGHQLLLLVRDDALGWAQVASLRSVNGTGAEALAQLVITGEDRSACLPLVARRDVRPQEPRPSRLNALQRGIDGLALSNDRAIAGLLRGVLLVALASSPGAMSDALGRYRTLLQHARDAAATGQRVSRQLIRRLVGVDSAQLVLWPLVAEGPACAELALGDLERVAALEREAREWAAVPDAKARALRTLLEDGIPSLVFTQAIATVQYLRLQLRRGVAWCTGRAAGLDAMTLTRESVLDWFRSPAGSEAPMARPRLLIATDVASEGLDLPLIGRVVHYDLPWTAVRFEQRSGRALRLGSRRGTVEVVRFLPPARLEAALRRQAILASKATLPDTLGLGQDSDAPWRVRASLAARWASVAARPGVAVVPGPARAVVAGVRVELADGSTRQLVRARLNGEWCGADALIAPLLERAWGLSASGVPPPGRVSAVLRGLAGPLRAMLRAVHGAGLSGPRESAAQRVLRRVLALAREAARTRDRERLVLLERGLQLLRRGHTAGESRLITEWLACSPHVLLGHFARLPASQQPAEVTRVELVGILLVEPDAERR